MTDIVTHSLLDLCHLHVIVMCFKFTEPCFGVKFTEPCFGVKFTEPLSAGKSHSCPQESCDSYCPLFKRLTLAVLSDSLSLIRLLKKGENQHELLGIMSWYLSLYVFYLSITLYLYLMLFPLMSYLELQWKEADSMENQLLLSS